MDAKSLLRAKQAEARVDHPFAGYTAAGVLRCTICAVPVKQWDAHLLTKQHRQAAQREREAQEKQKTKSAKRAVPLPPHSASPPAKRSRAVREADEEEEGEEEEDDGGGPSLPAGFFSTPRAVEPTAKEEEAEVIAEKAAEEKKPTGDAELDDFLSSLNDEPEVVAPTRKGQGLGGGRVGGFGFGSGSGDAALGQASYEAAPVRNLPAGEEGAAIKGGGEAEEKEEEETEQERRARVEREEREEIIGRLEEEERAQWVF